ncbi:NAD(P)H-dependent oxidoreductase [Cupriavidus sp. PET2-C1]
MSKTLILLFHPRFGQSKANRALCNAASTLPGVEIADLYALYPDGAIDVDAEVRRLLGADRIVFQFPLQWYATPALLKAWLDAVLTRMFYIAYETEGRALAGKPMLVAATAGNVRQAYGPGGVNLFPLAELLRPLQATANRCGLPWSEPFVLYEAGKLDDHALAAAGERYAVRLQHIAA